MRPTFLRFFLLPFDLLSNIFIQQVIDQVVSFACFLTLFNQLARILYLNLA